MIEKLFNEQTVAVNVKVNNWQEAITYGGNILVQNGYTEKQYIDAMIENVNKMGQYIVIAPGLAMPHARPEFGVKKIGMALVKLATPVPFGHEKYDPVDILIFLCATDQTTHIGALSELMQLLEDERFLNSVRNGMSKEKIIEYINEQKYIEEEM